MKSVKYKHWNLHTNSEAYKLLEESRRRPNDKILIKKLEQHLKEVDAKYEQMCGQSV